MPSRVLDKVFYDIVSQYGYESDIESGKAEQEVEDLITYLKGMKCRADCEYDLSCPLSVLCHNYIRDTGRSVCQELFLPPKDLLSIDSVGYLYYCGCTILRRGEVTTNHVIRRLKKFKRALAKRRELLQTRGRR